MLKEKGIVGSLGFSLPQMLYTTNATNSKSDNDKAFRWNKGEKWGGGSLWSCKDEFGILTSPDIRLSLDQFQKHLKTQTLRKHGHQSSQKAERPWQNQGRL